MLQAKRDEIKAKLESKYLKLENETRVKHFRAIKEMNTVEIEKLKIDKEAEANQKIKIITQEHELASEEKRAQANARYQKLSDE